MKQDIKASSETTFLTIITRINKKAYIETKLRTVFEFEILSAYSYLDE
jgi:hypothetical protein